jgi:hypothetical protein
VDFETIHKVDTHVHVASAPTAEHLLDFIKRKLRTSSNVFHYYVTPTDTQELVMQANGRDYTLKQIFDKSDISTENLTLDSLDVRVSLFSYTPTYIKKPRLAVNPWDFLTSLH